MKTITPQAEKNVVYVCRGEGGGGVTKERGWRGGGGSWY